MATKMLMLTLIFALNFILITGDDCDCPDSNDPTTKEVKELWDYLSPEKFDKTDLPVVPGELSPLTICNCIESKRTKRKIEGVKGHGTEERSREERSPMYFRAWRHANEQRNKCPFGYRRFAFMCVKHP